MSKKKDKFTDIWNDYYPLVFSAVNSKVENFDDTMDICQEVFVSFYNKYDEIENPRKWLYGALRMSVLNYYRVKTKNRGLNIDDVSDDVGLTFVNGLRDQRIIISSAIETLDEDDRILFELIAVQDYTYGNAAKHLGYTRRQIEHRYKRIVGAITDYLKKKGIKNIEDLL